MATIIHHSAGYTLAHESSERFQQLEQLKSNQMATIKEALTMANIILQLAAMDASLKGYISAAENTPDLVNRLLLVQRAASKEFELVNDVRRVIEEEQRSAEEISPEDVASRLERSTSEEKSVSSRRTSRTTARSSSWESTATRIESRRSVKGPVDIIRRTSTPRQMESSRPRSKSPQISELPRLGEDLDLRSSRTKSVAEAGHQSLRRWAAAFTGVFIRRRCWR